MRTLDHATARIAVQLAASIGVAGDGAAAAGDAAPHVPGRHHLRVALDGGLPASWEPVTAKACDRRAFLRGLLLSAGSVSGGPRRPARRVRAARPPQRATSCSACSRRATCAARAWSVAGGTSSTSRARRRSPALLRLVGANRALLDFETSRVSRDVRNRLNRLLNAEEANLARTVRAADRQLQAIGRLEADGELERLAEGLREAAAQRRRQPDADLDTLASSLGISRSAMNHRLRRLVELAADAGGEELKCTRSRPPLIAGNWKMNPTSAELAVSAGARGCATPSTDWRRGP